MNQTNKEEQSSAEPGEKRARAKENIVSFHTRPTRRGEIECARDGAVYEEQHCSSLIPGGSRMRKAARTVLCGGRSAMVVPTATPGGLSHRLFDFAFLGPSYIEQFAQLLCCLPLISRERVGLRHTVRAMTKAAQLAAYIADRKEGLAHLRRAPGLRRASLPPLGVAGLTAFNC
jgi:hypothetical protein